MQYDSGCCGGTDCRPVDEGEILDIGGDRYMVRATGEVFTNPMTDNLVEAWRWVELDNGRKEAVKVNGHWRISRDGQYHRCTMTANDPTSGTRCLYVPRPGV